MRIIFLKKKFITFKDIFNLFNFKIKDIFIILFKNERL